MLFWGQSKSKNATRYSDTFTLDANSSEIPADGASGVAPGTSVYFSKEFQLAANQNIEIKAKCPQVNNSWVYVQIDLYNKDTGEVYALDFPIEYYHGVSGGESWSEGSRHASKTISAVPAGTYVMRVSGQRSPRLQSGTLFLTVVQGVFNTTAWVLMFIVLNLIPVIVGIWHFIFERRRWSLSDFSGGDE